MFETLSDRLSGIFDKLTRRGALSEAETGPVGDSFVTLTALAEAGAGRAILPSILGDRAHVQLRGG